MLITLGKEEFGIISTQYFQVFLQSVCKNNLYKLWNYDLLKFGSGQWNTLKRKQRGWSDVPNDATKDQVE